MAERNWSMQDAKSRFSKIVEAAQRSPQTVTKHGKPAVVIIDVAEYERLRWLERANAPSFADVLLAMPQDNGEFPRQAADALLGPVMFPIDTHILPDLRRRQLVIPGRAPASS